MKSTISQEQISQTAVRLGIPDVAFTHRRIARAFDLFETSKVNELSHDEGFYRVHSQYDDKIYTVEVNHGNPSCSCPDGAKTVYCKHMIASLMMAFEQEQKAPVLTVKEMAHNERIKASWVVTDGNEYTTVWQDLNGKVCCVCGAYYKGDCIHKQLVREFCNAGNGSKMVNECGSETAKALQEKLNGNNGTGDIKSPSHNLDVSNPFEESEQLDIDQIEGRSNGDLVHKLSNGKYIISYHGIMALAEQHDVTFIRHTVKSDAKRDGTVVAHARLGNNTRASGKPMNGSFITAVELAKRNAARQLLPLPEIKAVERKAQLEAEFDWQKAKAKCLELLPEANLNILINDLVNDGTLAQKHPSDYSRKEWRLIYNTCGEDAKTNGDGANTPLPTDKFAECKAVAKHDIRYSWLKDAMLKEGVVSDNWTDADIAKLKEACEIDASLFGKELGHWTVEIQPNKGKWAYQRRWSFWLTPMSKRCFWCGKSRTESIQPDTCIHWGRYEIKASLCLECSEKVGNGELDKDRLVQKFGEVYRAYGGVGSSTAIFPDDTHEGGVAPSEPGAEVPDNVDEFIAKCKEMESEVDDPAPMVEDAQMDGDGKRKLVMDKKLMTWLVEVDGTKTEISCREICEQFDGKIVMQLRSGIDAGGDISTVELD